MLKCIIVTNNKQPFKTYVTIPSLLSYSLCTSKPSVFMVKLLQIIRRCLIKISFNFFNGLFQTCRSPSTIRTTFFHSFKTSTRSYLTYQTSIFPTCIQRMRQLHLHYFLGVFPHGRFLCRPLEEQ